MGLKTGQYYLRARPARDAIQFTLDLDNLDAKEDGNYNTKNLSKAEMAEQRRLNKKRSHGKMAGQSGATGVAASSQADLTKKRKVSEMGSGVAVAEKAKDVKEAGKAVVEAGKAAETGDDPKKPWEKQEKEKTQEEEDADQDYRWNICENCQ